MWISRPWHVLLWPLALFVFSACAAVEDQVGDPVALVGGRVYASPQDDPILDAVVVMSGGVIVEVGPRSSVAVPPGAAVIDCSGLTVVAGFWNSHVHFFELRWLDAGVVPAAGIAFGLEQMVTRFGFTNVFDIGSDLANTQSLRDRIESGEIMGPRIRSTGAALVAPGAMPPADVLRESGIMAFEAPEIEDATQAAAAAKVLLTQGADGIKVHLKPPKQLGAAIAESSVRAVVRVTHDAGRQVFVHPHTTADVSAAVQSGVDIVAHTTPASGAWDATVLVGLKQSRAALTPTLSLWDPGGSSPGAEARKNLGGLAVEQLRAWIACGGRVLFGTDLGAVAYDPSPEYALMESAGMGFRQILASLTTMPARQFGESASLGRVAPGFQADLAVLAGDPAQHISALADVRYTVRAGKVIYRYRD